MNILCDPAAERAVLSGICRYGRDAYLDVADYVQHTTFTVDSNVVIYKCLKSICDNEDIKSIDVASIYSKAQELDLSHFFTKKEEAQHLKAILDFPTNLENIRKFAAKIRKLEITRLLRSQLELANDKLLEVTGAESIANILGIAEQSIFDFSSLLTDEDNNTVHIAKDIDEYLQSKMDNPVDQLGIPTGYPIYDKAIGGGLRPGTVNLIGARSKVGKSFLVDNMSLHIGEQLSIPCLDADTEMTKEDHVNRLLAIMTEVEIDEIETGKFVNSPDKKAKILEAKERLKKLPYHYKSIAGKPFEEQLAIMRRWVCKEVGLNDDGTAKPCVIFYDYLKLMDTQGLSADLKEYQLLGFMMTALHNFAVRYKIPIVSFIQLNRDGITKESAESASGSDRIIWLCSNFTIYKYKSDEEIAEDGSKNGNRKMVPVLCRHGGGLDQNDYINFHFTGWCGKIVEGKTKLQIAHSKPPDGGFVTDEDDDQIPFN